MAADTGARIVASGLEQLFGDRQVFSSIDLGVTRAA